MYSDITSYFTKENLDIYLKELGREYRRLNGKAMPAEIVLIGGAAIVANYNFRHMTTDVDAVIHAASSIKDAINIVGDKFHLPSNWLNADFMHTGSYSPKLDLYSTHYREFSNVLKVRSISAEYLVAMKLRSGRRYKNDLSDIIGILAEHEKFATSITMADIDKAVTNLYGGWDDIPITSKTFIENAMKNGNFTQTYQAIRAEEMHSKELLINFEQAYPNTVQTDNVNPILNTLRKREQSKEHLLAHLKSSNTS